MEIIEKTGRDPKKNFIVLYLLKVNKIEVLPIGTGVTVGWLEGGTALTFASLLLAVSS